MINIESVFYKWRGSMSNGCNMRFQTDSGFWPRKKKKNIINNLPPRLLNIKLLKQSSDNLNPSSFVRLCLRRLEPTFLQLRNQYQLITEKFALVF